MDELLQKINARPQHYNRDELLALIWDFLTERDEDDLADFLDLMRQKSRPAAVAASELVDEKELLGQIQELYDALANDEYVEYGSGYDPDYGEYRGFGDDSWIDAMDSLFAAATSLYRAGNDRGAAAAYAALFDIFSLAEDGYHFTRPDPPAALQTDLDVIKRQLFTALGNLDPDPEAFVPVADDDDEERAERTLLELSSELSFYGDNRYALLDAWEPHPDWMQGLEAHLRAICRRPVGQEQHVVFLSHPAELLREFARRTYGLAEREALCRAIGPQQGWPYVDLVATYQEQGQWPQVLAWADDGLGQLLPQSTYRATLEEARGAALLQLNRPAEALTTLQGLFKRKRELPVYLALRAAAAGAKPDDVLRTAMGAAPRIIREHGELLEREAQNLSLQLLLDSAVRLYERLVNRAVDGRKRESYAVAGSHAKVIWAIRKLQGRTADFEHYYQGLLAAYPRLSAFKDELRSAIEGPGYKRKR